MLIQAQPGETSGYRSKKAAQKYVIYVFGSLISIISKQAGIGTFCIYLDIRRVIGFDCGDE